MPAAAGVSQASTFDSWDSVKAFAMALPGAEESTSYGRPTVRIRSKPIVYPTREPESFAIAASLDEKQFLIETDPNTFWDSAHFSGWPAVLVRYGSAERERIETVIRRAWWDRLSKAQQREFGERP